MDGWDKAREMGSMMWHGMEIKGTKEGRHVSCMMDGERGEERRGDTRENSKSERG